MWAWDPKVHRGHGPETQSSSYTGDHHRNHGRLCRVLLMHQAKCFPARPDSSPGGCGLRCYHLCRLLSFMLSLKQWKQRTVSIMVLGTVHRLSLHYSNVNFFPLTFVSIWAWHCNACTENLLSQVCVNNLYHLLSALSINANHPNGWAEERTGQDFWQPGKGEREEGRFRSVIKKKEERVHRVYLDHRKP